MPRQSFHHVSRLVPVVLVLAVASACDTIEPELPTLSGSFNLEEWTWVNARGDSIPITGNSFVELTFGAGSEVTGEGFVEVVFPTQSGGSGDTIPILGRLRGDGFMNPIDLQGWYSVHPGDTGPDTLRLRLQRGFGANTWLENFDWMLADDRLSFIFDNETTEEWLRIVYRKR